MKKKLIAFFFLLCFGVVSMAMIMNNGNGQSYFFGLLGAETEQENPEPKEVGMNRTYTASTETTCDINGKCNLILYSGTRFVYEDDKWKKVENAKSLKDAWNKVYLEEDLDFDIDIIHVNYTDLELNFSFYPLSNITELIEKYPECADSKENDIKCDFKLDVKEEVCDENNTCEKVETKFQYKYQLKDGILKEDLKYVYKGNPLGKEYTFGGNSTTIKLQDANSENLEDTEIEEANADTNFGSATALQINARAVDGREEGLFKFNISQIPVGQQIDNAIFYAYMFTEGIDTGEEFHADVHHNYNQTWIEEDITWNKVVGIHSYNSTYEDRWTVTGTNPTPDAPAWVNWTTTNMISKAYGDGDVNITIWVRTVYSSGNPSTSDEVVFRTKEYTTVAQRPYLNITYSEAPLPADTCTPETNWVIEHNCSLVDKANSVDNLTITEGASLNLTGNTNLTTKCVNLTSKGGSALYPLNVSTTSRLNITGCDFW